MDVITAGKLGYPRTNLAIPGPVGGPCLEKDPYILAEGLEPFGLKPEITLSARRVNERLPEEVGCRRRGAASAMPGFPARPVVAVLGLAFKGRPATDDLRGTMARPILASLRRRFQAAEWRGYDAVVAPDAFAEFGLKPCATLGDGDPRRKHRRHHQQPSGVRRNAPRIALGEAWESRR